MTRLLTFLVYWLRGWAVAVGVFFMVVVPAAAMENVAAGKDVTANDVYLTYAGSRAVDGDLATQWTASGHGTVEAPKRLEVDLGAVFRVDRISLFFTYSGGVYEGFSNEYRLSFSEDGVVWTGVGQGTLIDTEALPQRTNTWFPAVAVRRARHVRYEVVGGSHWAQLFELQVWAAPVVIHSLAGEWSDGVNPMAGGRWSIRSGDWLLRPIEDLGATRVDTWDGLQPGLTGLGVAGLDDVVPSWFKAGSVFTGVGSPTDWRAGDVVVHSGRSYHPPTQVCWKSPRDGWIAATGGVWPVRELGRDNNWRLLLNGRLLSDGLIGSGDMYSREQPFVFSAGSGGPGAVREVMVRTGDELCLAMTPAGGGIPDYAGVALEVEQTPAPTGGRYDFERDFAAGVNGAGENWSYRSGAARDGNYALMPFFHTTGHEGYGFARFPAWHAADDDEALPHVGVNVYPYALRSTTGIVVEPGHSHVHPGRDGALGVVSFRAPQSGTLLIDCGFADLDAAGGDGVVWWVDRADGAEIASGRVLNGGDSGVMRLPPQFVLAGERIHFLVGAGGTAESDTTRVRAGIELVPAVAPHTSVDFDGAFGGGVLVDSRGLEWSGEGGVTVATAGAKWGGAARFDGDGDALTPTVPTNELSPGADPFTVDFWLYPLRDGRGDYVLGQSRPDAGQGWDLRLDYGEILVTGVNGWQVNMGTENVDDRRYLQSNQWHHVALSCTETWARLFVDGRLRGESARGTIGGTANAFRLGWQENHGGPGFQGAMDEFRYWRQAVWTSDFQPPASPGMGDTALAASVPVVGVDEPEPGQLRLRWPTRRGLEYGVEASAGLLGWEVHRPYAAPSGMEDEVVVPMVPADAGGRFYRIGTRFGSR